ncbi:hypothetical protein KB221_10840 [Aquidulcibacter paucihalophilus]|nr:hypothetical protein KB221_10840 [Aquidulcibacter paucihalophilus]
MSRLTLPLIAAAGLALSACASLAPYGAQMGPGGQGYAEQRIESNRFRVTYNGVGAPGPVMDMALLRAAELTTAEGYDWFEVTQRWTDGRAGQRRRYATQPRGQLRRRSRIGTLRQLLNLGRRRRGGPEFQRPVADLDHARGGDGERVETGPPERLRRPERSGRAAAVGVIGGW